MKLDAITDLWGSFWLRLKLRHYERAEREMGKLHPDLPRVVLRIHELRDQLKSR